MKLLNLKIVKKHLNKNRGNYPLQISYKNLIEEFSTANCLTHLEFKKIRPDADNVYEYRCFFLDLTSHRTLVQVDYIENLVKFMWIGTHDNYVSTFRGNKKTIERYIHNKNREI